VPDILRIDASDVLEAFGDIEKLGRVGRIAIKRAVRKATQYALREAASQVAAETRIPRRALTESGKGKRIHARGLEGNDNISPRGYIWIGYNPIGASRVGKPRQTLKGTRVGKHEFPGSFVATMPSGFRSSFHRTRKARRVPADNRWGITTSLPIEEDVVPLQGAREAAKRVQLLARIRLRQLMAQELNFQINVRGLRRGS